MMKNIFAPLLFNGLILTVVLTLVGVTHTLATPNQGEESTKLPLKSFIQYCDDAVIDTEMDTDFVTKESGLLPL
jgi:hypothetical protein